MREPGGGGNESPIIKTKRLFLHYCLIDRNALQSDAAGRRGDRIQTKTSDVSEFKLCSLN